MKRFLLIIQICFAFILQSSAQDHLEEPVIWNWEVTKKSDKTYEVKFVANISKSWHIYSQNLSKDAPATPTTFSFLKNPLILIEGKPNEIGKKIIKNEPVMNVDIAYYANKVEFVQEVKVKGNVKTNLRGTISFQACTNTFCLPPDEKTFELAFQ
ncbi:protein-disulfide reductase DsbD domain-containing protein [Paraflavitalea sp. CAU 1676]|uniref:protein-disulfide reductase DsbD domain-containing protein n=1 Tax=Paraflavitalea sp. CAU 1676 TaxID=3032598 RepID=UPI0023D9D653|nr:protein-disulfide reductase DsbD domain-containing protein [Paraflavitalea sp. CAU 1676]MDF2190537.1 protein-disulfide reductase DsbD family protein [Paraflavitalea sp. CAU 1676]